MDTSLHGHGWLYWALLSALFATLTTIFAKVGIQSLDSDFATLLRTGMVVLLLSGFVVATGKWGSLQTIAPKTWLFLALSALATGASWVCYFRALQIGQTAQVALVDKSSLVLVVLLAFVFLGEQPTLRQWCGIALIASGVLVLASKK